MHKSQQARVHTQHAFVVCARRVTLLHLHIVFVSLEPYVAAFNLCIHAAYTPYTLHVYVKPPLAIKVVLYRELFL
ncbi:hypothetical protein HMPREF9248_0101 [Fannyhessea vaginae PB189-T1-4]|uniref:Uncharacterized protein n=1 Tax=Fannyhessea vaginae PB189-T1-4 TaxID=866774 RepID=A0ABN0AY97_9ACTN|nr:hypothetical protein HMPREF9248_0101 [Fannyhessea vaginae PB189-T1-4]